MVQRPSTQPEKPCRRWRSRRGGADRASTLGSPCRRHPAQCDRAFRRLWGFRRAPRCLALPQPGSTCPVLLLREGRGVRWRHPEDGDPQPIEFCTNKIHETGKTRETVENGSSQGKWLKPFGFPDFAACSSG